MSKKSKAKKASTTSSADNSKICAVLSYILIGLIWYLVDESVKKNAFAKYHVKQGLVLLIFAIIVWIVDAILMFIPVIGWLAIVILELLLLVLVIIGIVNAINDKQAELPVIGKYANKFKF